MRGGASLTWGEAGEHRWDLGGHLSRGNTVSSLLSGLQALTSLLGDLGHCALPLCAQLALGQWGSPAWHSVNWQGLTTAAI